MSHSSQTSPESTGCEPMEGQMSLLGERHAKTCASETRQVKVFQVVDPDCPGTSLMSLPEHCQGGSYGRTSKRLRAGSTLQGSHDLSQDLLPSGMVFRGEYWTADLSEWHSDENVSSLSEVLEADVADEFFLSDKAIRGILKRKRQPQFVSPEGDIIATTTARTLLSKMMELPYDD